MLVWTPAPDAARRLDRAGGTPQDVTLDVWDGGELPGGAAEVEVVVTAGGARGLEQLGRLPRLRLVQSTSDGVEGLLPHVPAGVTLARAVDVHAPATAEWVVAATLAVVRELPRFVREADAGRWSPRSTRTLRGARVVVLGAGSIARHARDRFEPFGAQVALVGRTARDGVAGMQELPDLLATADVLVVLVPLTEATRGLVDADLLARLPDGAVVLNAARGPVVDTDALLAEVTSGRLVAALDVTDPEPLPPDHPLLTAPGALVTPHVAGDVDGDDDLLWDLVAAQLRRLAAGEELEGVVDPDRGY